MFFLIGITNGLKKLNFSQNTLCPSCGRMGQMEVYMTYLCLSLFFIPIIKWGRHYYAQSSCCGQRFQLSDELGKKISRGESVILSDLDLSEQLGGCMHECSNCGTQVGSDYLYCPKCGQKLK
ncbi:MAG: zinc ribbon domain-containing protein [Clostridiales bacterium]|nr:zinc ribbon domain-containing protein [Clostridiales bacterium]